MLNLHNFTKRENFAKIGLGLWAAVVSVVISLLVGGHFAPFAAVSALPAAVEYTHSLNQQTTGWQMLHVVAENCLCSQDVIDHLLGRGRSEKKLSAEGVLFVGHSPDLKARFEKAGFHFKEIEAASVTEMTGLEAAPTLLVIDEQGSIRYTGGYYQRRERTEALDLKILQSLIAGQIVKPLPLFGCAFSKRLQLASDPLGLKYSRQPTSTTSRSLP